MAKQPSQCHDSTFDEIDKLLQDKEFCRFVESLNDSPCKLLIDQLLLVIWFYS
jgi:hypothetical protein